MTNLISSLSTALHGTLTLPGDKSLSHRAALFAALAQGNSRIENFLVSGVTGAMLNALTLLGVSWKLQGRTLTIHGRGVQGIRSPSAPIDCGNSATTMRLLAGAVALAGISAVLDGSDGLHRRPMGRIVDPLRQMGVSIRASNGCAPLKLQPSRFPLRALDTNLPVASAQLKTCLLLAALAGDGPTSLREPGPSRDHTERMLGSMGISLTSALCDVDGQAWYETRLIPPRPLVLSPLTLRLPGDFSSAAFLIVAALITPGSTITLQGVGLNPGRTGLLDVLLEMGADIRISAQSLVNGEPVGDLTVQASRLRGVQISGEQVVRMIDEIPAFAVAALCAGGSTTVRDASELRHKESDRIAALCQELRSLGAQIQETADGFYLQGGTPLAGGSVHSHSDHRLAMSLAVLGLSTRNGVEVEQAEIIDESFPEFVQVLQTLGANIAYQPVAEAV